MLEAGPFRPRGHAGSVLTLGPTPDLDPLVARAQLGDRGAFAELFRRHRSDVARLVYRLLGRPSDVEDVVQDVFLQVHKSLADFRGQSKFGTWLHRVTVNVVLMARRAARSRPVFAEPPAREPISPHAVAPDEGVSRLRRLEAFRRLLEALPEKKRTVFLLHELEGMSPAEISVVVDAPVLTVRTRLFYARKELCDLMATEPALAGLVAELGIDRSRVSLGASGRDAAAGLHEAEGHEDATSAHTRAPDGVAGSDR